MLWVVLNGKLNWEIVFFGIVIAGALDALSNRLMGNRFGHELRVVAAGFRLLGYFAELVKEIVLCSLQVIRLILQPKLEVEPQLVRFQPNIQNESLRVLLSNSITLTPGTITVWLSDDRLVVHGLDKRFLTDIDQSRFVKLLEKEDARCGK